MESFITIGIFIHAALGGIALISGLISLLSKKGNTRHKKAGLLFYYSMLSSTISAIIAFMPNHENPILLTIGVFSSYFIITGYSLRFTKNNPNVVVDKPISILIFVST